MLKLYNTLTKQKEELKPINPGKVGMYSCGPTVYDYAHIGNLKTFIFEDVLRRYLEYLGYETKYFMNITDVGHLTADDINQADTGEDKMLKAALREKKTPEEIANFYTERFMEDIGELNFIKANYYPRATAHISQIIKLVEELVRRGLAYEANGNVFFEVSKFKGYGKLSGKKIDELKAGARLEEHPDKRNPFDFALWLKAPEKHLLKWPSPWSLGYPGWHIECSAMSIEYLGDTFDIHAGGEDHIFPHHENEIAQSEGATGKKFVNYWLHARFLLVEGRKMSKSKGNFYALKDIIAKDYLPMHFRVFVLSGHYRTNVNFTWSVLDQAKANYNRIKEWFEKMERISNDGISMAGANEINFDDYKQRFEEAMDDDLNTPLALSVLFALITETNKLSDQSELGQEDARSALGLWKKMNKVFGLIVERKEDIPEDITKLAEERQAVRQDKNFSKSDELRDEISEKGWIIEDLKDNNYKLIKK